MEGRGKKRKCKGKYYAKKRAKSNSLQPGLKGFIVTCHEKRARGALNEAYRLLRKYADTIYGPEQLVPDGSGSDDDLESQLGQLKAKQGSPRRFHQASTGMPNCLFITAQVEDPALLAKTIMEDIYKSQEDPSKEDGDKEGFRSLIRLLPVSVTCKAHTKPIVEAVENLVKKDSRTSQKFRVTIKSRHNSGFDKDGVMREVIEAVQRVHPDWIPTYHNFTHTILVDVICTVCCLSVIEDFERLRKYNLVELTSPRPKDDGDEASLALLKTGPSLPNDTLANCTEDTSPSAINNGKTLSGTEPPSSSNGYVSQQHSAPDVILPPGNIVKGEKTETNDSLEGTKSGSS